MVSEASLGDGWVRILEQQGGIRQARVASCMSVLPAVLPRGLCSLASGASGLGCLLTLAQTTWALCVVLL